MKFTISSLNVFLYFIFFFDSAIVYANDNIYQLKLVADPQYTTVPADLSSRSRKDIYDAINAQFELYKDSGIDLNIIENLYELPHNVKKELALSRIQIVDGKLYTENFFEADKVISGSSVMYNSLILALQRILKKHQIPNVDFIFLAHDNLAPPDEAKKLLLHAPIFLMSKNLSSPLEREKLLLPDAYILSKKIWPKLISNISHAAISYPWPNKDSSKVFWRGSTTGGEYSLKNYSSLKRLSLVMLTKSFPDKIDAAFTNYVQFSPSNDGKDLEKTLRKLFGEPDQYSLKTADHLKYKYLISIDGNTCAWGRVPWILLSNSVLLKQETNFQELFYAGLEPFIHYVPINEDLSDIFEKLRWLQENDNIAKEISKNASKFVEDNLKPSDIDEYVFKILNKYHQLQNFKVIVPSLPLVKEIYN